MSEGNNPLLDRIQDLSPAKRALLERRLRAQSRGPRQAGIVPRGHSDPSVLSFNQQRQWFLERLHPGSAAYNVWTSVRLDGPLDVEAMERAVEMVANRHETLRTRFVEEAGEPRQVVEPVSSLELNVLDLRALPGDERAGEAERLANEEATTPLELEKATVSRMTLYQLSDTDHVLLLVLNHIISDGWSRRIFMRDLGEAYTAQVSKGEPEWPDLPVQYADFAAWQTQELGEASLEKQLAYWTKRLQGADSSLDLVTDFPHSAKTSDAGAAVEQVLDGDLLDRLQEFAKEEGATAFMVLIAAYAGLLGVYSGQTDLVVGTPIAGRGHSGLENLIGFFANTVPLRMGLEGDPSFRDLVARVRDETLGAFANQDLPFEKLVEAIRPDRELGRTPVFQTMFSLQNIPDPPVRFGDLAVRRFPVESGAVPFELFLRVIPEGETWRAQLRYRSDLYRASTMERLLEHFRNLLARGLANPDSALSSLLIIDEAEERRARVDWNATASDYPRDATVGRLFSEVAREAADAPALVHGSKILTYGQLDAAANRLAHHLRGIGVGHQDVVGVFAERVPDTVVALLGILKSGAPYLPLDPEQPVPRTEYMLSNSSARVLLTHETGEGLTQDGSFPEVFSPSGLQVVDLGAALQEIAPGKSDDPDEICGPESPAYIIYTSGSTGAPKGVAVTHRNLIRLVRGSSFARFGPDRVFLQTGPVSFDASVFEIWGALLNGSPCVLYPDRLPTSGKLRKLIKDHGVTTLWLTSTLFNAIIDEAPESLAGAEEILVGGEALSPLHVVKAQEALPDTRLINGYGPTENTTFSCTYPIPRRDWTKERSVPVGRPVSNSTAYVLDPSSRICPVGVPGELHVGGDGVALGYVGDPDLTKARFIPDPFTTEPGARLYKTGDRCRYLDGGSIEYLGRDDHQVKIRGYRIEPGEIESVLHGHPGVKDVAVTAADVGSPGGAYLVAYVVPDPDLGAPSVEDLKREVRGMLPSFMVPAVFMMIEEMPLTEAGKVARMRLPPPVRPRSDREGEIPRDAVEVQLAAIWSRVLGVEGIRRDDSFFDLGGNSLLALRLFAEIESTLGEDLPLASLFRATTVAEMAALIRTRSPESGWGVVVPIQRKGSRPPFFCVHGVLGNVIGQGQLAQLIHPDQPFYGVQAQGLGGGAKPLTTVDEMASLYLSEIRKVQPEGPYLLGGYCLGALVAHRMAQRLSEEGHEVPLLVLIDPTGLLGGTAGSNPTYLGLLRRWLLYLLPGGNRTQRLERAHNLARYRYAATPYPGRTLLLRSTGLGGDRASSDARFRRWKEVLPGKVENHILETSHWTVLLEPAVNDIAAIMDQSIKNALGLANAPDSEGEEG